MRESRPTPGPNVFLEVSYQVLPMKKSKGHQPQRNVLLRVTYKDLLIRESEG